MGWNVWNLVDVWKLGRDTDFNYIWSRLIPCEECSMDFDFGRLNHLDMTICIAASLPPTSLDRSPFGHLNSLQNIQSFGLAIPCKQQSQGTLDIYFFFGSFKFMAPPLESVASYRPETNNIQSNPPVFGLPWEVWAQSHLAQSVLLLHVSWPLKGEFGRFHWAANG